MFRIFRWWSYSAFPYNEVEILNTGANATAPSCDEFSGRKWARGNIVFLAVANYKRGIQLVHDIRRIWSIFFGVWRTAFGLTVASCRVEWMNTAEYTQVSSSLMTPLWIKLRLHRPAFFKHIGGAPIVRSNLTPTRKVTYNHALQLQVVLKLYLRQ